MTHLARLIGTAKPTPAERQQVAHHLIDVVPVSEPYNIKRYLEDAWKAVRGIMKRGKKPLVVDWVGGTHSFDPPSESFPGPRGEAFAAWRRYFESLAERRPLVLVFEDLHWADDGLLDFVDYLADWGSGVPLLLLGTARPELLVRRPGWGGGKSNALTLSLAPLSDEETTQLVHSLFEQSNLEPETHQVLLERAGGNPLYAEEFVRLVEQGREQTALPESVQAIIAARLDALDPGHKQLVRQAAVLGKVFWLGGLAEVADVERWKVEEQLHGLERREFVRRERSSSVAAETEYAFRHALVREVAYEQLPRAERAERHRRAARWIESLGRPEETAEMLAHHYLAALEYARAAGGPTDDFSSSAAAALRSAGERALALYAFPSAQRFFSAALELVAPNDPDRPLLLLASARAQYATAGPAAADSLAEASRQLEQSGDRELAAEAEVILAELCWSRGDRASTNGHLARAEELIGAGGPSPSRARVLSEISRYHMLAGRYEQAFSVGQEAIRLARELGQPAIEAHALNNVGTALVNKGDESGGVAHLEAGLAIALEVDPREAGRIYNNLSTVIWRLGQTWRSGELQQASARTSAEYGLERLVRWNAGVLAGIEFLRGRWDEFVAQADRFAADIKAQGGHYLQAVHLAYLARILIARDREDEALAAARFAVQAALELNEAQAMMPALVSLALVEAELGNADAAQETLERLSEYRVADPSDLVLLATAEIPAAAQVVERLAGQLPAANPWRRLLADLLAGDAERVAVELDVLGLPAYAAAVRMRWAPEMLNRALEFWRDVRATRYVRRVESLLSKTG
jgi:tetratricopeptide (TPR) repeat protein